MGNKNSGGGRKPWEEYSESYQEDIKRDYLRTVQCDECCGPLVFFGKEDRTMLWHEKWCSVPSRFRELVLGVLNGSVSVLWKTSLYLLMNCVG